MCLFAAWHDVSHAQSNHLTEQIRFHHVTQKQGSRSTVFNDVIEDRNGFIWATNSQGGQPGGSYLLKFDGHRFKAFGNDFHAKTDLAPASMDKLLEDSDGRIWVGSHKRLHCFVPAENRFYHCPSKVATEQTVDVVNIFEDSQKRIWVGGRERAYLVDKDSMQLQPLGGPSFQYDHTNWPGIQAFGEGSDGQIWAGSDRGLYRVETDSLTIEEVPFPDQPEWGTPYIHLVQQKEGNRFFIGTSAGLWLFDADSMRVEKIAFSGVHLTYPVYDVLVENGELKWVATARGLFHLENGKATHYTHDDDNEFSLISNNVRALMLDRSGNLWIATGDGIDLVNFNKTPFSFYQVTPGYTARNNYVYRVMEDQFGALWFRHPHIGLTRADSLGGEYEVIIRNSNYLTIKNSLLLPNGKIWVSTNGGGILEIDPLEKIPRQLPLGDSVQTLVYAESVDSSEPQYVWGFTNHGLLRIDYQTLQQKWYDPKESLPWLQWSLVGFNIRPKHHRNRIYVALNRRATLGYLDLDTEKFALVDSEEKCTFHSIRGMVEDGNGLLWMAAKTGLLRLDPSTNDYRLFTVRDGIGLPENNLMGVQLDSMGNVWFTTQHHICKFDKEAFYCFDLRDQAIFFPNNNSGKMADGRILFGACGGLYVVDPKAFEANVNTPPVFLTDFSIGSEPVPLDKSPELVTDLKLDFSQNTCAFEFAALEFFYPENVRYKYRLIGLENKWSSPTAERRINFSQLPPGRYTFQVIASSGNENWTSEANALSVNLTVRPPWYRTDAARLAFALLAAALAYLFFQYRMKRQLEKQEAQRIKELSEVKTQLYANITHEFRTPLTLILGPANKAQQQLGEMREQELRNHLSTIERNGKLLLERVNQLLDLNKIEAGLMKCNYEQTDVVPFLKSLLESFHSLAEAKGISLRFHSDMGSMVMDYDREKWMSVFSNLLTNAMKYTPENGTVALSVFKSGNRLEIKVEDTGIGIPNEKLPLIFDRFYQVDSSDKKTVQGTGIGLALVREYVRLLNGQINVESELGKGSVFRVILPIANQAPLAVVPQAETPTPQVQTANGTKDQLIGQQPLVLIVEDQSDVARFIGQCLGNSYRLAFATNGREGIERAKTLIPDFILSDVMMPEMGGLEVCQKLKSDELTLHIPVVLLTAKAGTEARMEGLKAGADAYLTKPFHEEELLVRIEKLTELRERLRRKYAGQAVPDEGPKEADFFVTGDPFLQKVNTLIDAHLDDEALNADFLSNELFYSKMQVHRKIKALTDHSTANYIRTYRLHRSRELLRSGQFNVSEVAWRVGFRSLSYFSTSFKDAFGISPQQFQENA